MFNCYMQNNKWVRVMCAVCRIVSGCQYCMICSIRHSFTRASSLSVVRLYNELQLKREHKMSVWTGLKKAYVLLSRICCRMAMSII